MTHLSSVVSIEAPAEKIYAMAAATEKWPAILPHYRYVRVLSGDGRKRVVEMGASRDGIPISWTAEQINDPHEPRITFRHLRGWTKGMDVAWRFAELDGITHVTIEHHLQFAFPVASDWLGRNVVGGFFVDNVAGKTLARMKMLAEAAAR